MLASNKIPYNGFKGGTLEHNMFWY